MTHKMSEGLGHKNSRVLKRLFLYHIEFRYLLFNSYALGIVKNAVAQDEYAMSDDFLINRHRIDVHTRFLPNQLPCKTFL